jgi:hypothetical protein
VPDLVLVEQQPDVVAELYAHPHFNHGCEPKFEVSATGLVYCADCAAQIGSVDPGDFAGLTVGGNGRASRWLRHEAIEQAWKEGGKEKKE